MSSKLLIQWDRYALNWPKREKLLVEFIRCNLNPKSTQVVTCTGSDTQAHIISLFLIRLLTFYSIHQTEWNQSDNCIILEVLFKCSQHIVYKNILSTIIHHHLEYITIFHHPTTQSQDATYLLSILCELRITPSWKYVYKQLQDIQFITYLLTLLKRESALYSIILHTIETIFNIELHIIISTIESLFIESTIDNTRSTSNIDMTTLQNITLALDLLVYIVHNTTYATPCKHFYLNSFRLQLLHYLSMTLVSMNPSLRFKTIHIFNQLLLLQYQIEDIFECIGNILLLPISTHGVMLLETHLRRYGVFEPISARNQIMMSCLEVIFFYIHQNPTPTAMPSQTLHACLFLSLLHLHSSYPTLHYFQAYSHTEYYLQNRYKDTSITDVSMYMFHILYLLCTLYDSIDYNVLHILIQAGGCMPVTLSFSTYAYKDAVQLLLELPEDIKCHIQCQLREIVHVENRMLHIYQQLQLDHILTSAKQSNGLHSQSTNEAEDGEIATLNLEVTMEKTNTSTPLSNLKLGKDACLSLIQNSSSPSPRKEHVFLTSSSPLKASIKTKLIDIAKNRAFEQPHLWTSPAKSLAQNPFPPLRSQRSKKFYSDLGFADHRKLN